MPLQWLLKKTMRFHLVKSNWTFSISGSIHTERTKGRTTLSSTLNSSVALSQALSVRPVILKASRCMSSRAKFALGVVHTVARYRGRPTSLFLHIGYVGLLEGPTSA